MHVQIPTVNAGRHINKSKREQAALQGLLLEDEALVAEGHLRAHGDASLAREHSDPVERLRAVLLAVRPSLDLHTRL